MESTPVIQNAEESAEKVEEILPVEVFDSITEEELRNSITVPILKGHEVQVVVPISLSLEKFWDLYLATDCEHWIGKFYDMRGEKKIENGRWDKPTSQENQYDKDAAESQSMKGKI